MAAAGFSVLTKSPSLHQPPTQVWDLATRVLQATLPFDDAQLGDMQNGLLWLDAATLASVSLNGDLNLLDPAAAEPAGARKAALQGHQVGQADSQPPHPALSILLTMRVSPHR